MNKWIRSFLSLFFPACCIVCRGPLRWGEECLCMACDMNIPRTNYHLQRDNPVEKLFWGKISIEKASSFFFYRRGSDMKHILHQLKYGGRYRIGEQLGRMSAGELFTSGFFAGVDVIVPVPLHRQKKKKRGYNQSEHIAGGISMLTGIPVDTLSVVRARDTETQTHKSAFSRWENVDGVFTLLSPGKFACRHILIVDDVLTTGATIIACAEAFNEVEGIKISVLTLAVAGQ